VAKERNHRRLETLLVIDRKGVGGGGRERQQVLPLRRNQEKKGKIGLSNGRGGEKLGIVHGEL